MLLSHLCGSPCVTFCIKMKKKIKNIFFNRTHHQVLHVYRSTITGTYYFQVQVHNSTPLGDPYLFCICFPNPICGSCHNYKQRET